jgi:phytanoyl-CoA hydroxylase
VPADPEHALWKIMNPDRFDPCLAECLRLPRLLDAVASLIGGDLLAFLLQFIYKPPGVAEAIHPFHQDGVFFRFEPHDAIVGAWLALDPVDADNGTLCVVPGSHRLPVTDHRQVPGVNKDSLAASSVEGDAEVLAKAFYVEIPPGDGVLFHPHLYHRTGGNRTQRHRRVITIHFAAATCRPTAEIIREFGFTSVRGRTYEGCLQPLASPDIGFRL